MTCKSPAMRGLMLLAVGALCLAPTPTRGININVDLETTFHAPASDPDASRLQAIMEYVEDYYEEIIGDTWYLSIHYRWEENIGSGGGALGIHTCTSDQGGRETVAYISFNPAYAWYFDPTPHLNEEYDMVQRRYQELTPAEQADWFSGSPPDNLEAGYQGVVLAGTPAESLHDLLSVALHEVGHALGMTHCVASGEADDGDYDFDPDFVYGATMAARCPPSDEYHLADNRALMYPSISNNLRRLPSATDIFSMAAASDWQQIDLPRKELLGSNWNTSAHWQGNERPDYSDDVFVRAGGTPEITGGAWVGNLLVAEWTRLRVGEAHSLAAAERITVQYNPGYGTSSITVAEGGNMSATFLDIDGGYVYVNGGMIDAGYMLTTDWFDGNAGKLLGYGVVTALNIDINSGGIYGSDMGDLEIRVDTRLDNDGVIQAGTGRTLTITDPNPSSYSLNLDGDSGNGEVDARYGSIVFDAHLTNDFSGTMRIGSGQSVTFNYAFTLGPGCLLDINGNYGLATLAGAKVFQEGQINVTGDARIDNDAAFRDSSNVNLADGATLDLNGEIDLYSGSFAGNGTIVQDNHLTVKAGESPTVDVDLYDWDGHQGSSLTTIESGASLYLTTDQIDDNPTIDGFDGTATINSGSLRVEINNGGSWRLDGMMNLNQTDIQEPSLLGSTMELCGRVNVDGNASISAPLEIDGGSISVPNFDDHLELNALTFYQGGEDSSITGNGKVTQNGRATVLADTSIDVRIYDWDGTLGYTETFVEPGAAFTINALKLEDDSQEGYDGEITVTSGTLNVNLTYLFRMEGTMNLIDSSGPPTVGGTEMIVSGELFAQGTARITAETQFDGATVDVASVTDRLELNGPTTFKGGSYTGPGQIIQNGDATVETDTTLAVGIYDMDGQQGTTTVTLGDTLTLTGGRLSESLGNRFDGTLIVEPGGRLNVQTTSGWQMAGTTHLTNLGGASEETQIEGRPMYLTGTLEVDGAVAIGAPMALFTGSLVELDSIGDSLRLGAASEVETILDGGEVAGPGYLRMLSGRRLVGTGELDCNVDFGPNADLFARGGTLSVTGTLLSVRTVGTSDATGTFEHSTAWDTVVADELRLNGGRVQGGEITNTGLTVGHGTIDSRGFRNEGTVRAEGGTLTFSLQTLTGLTTPDLDGSSGFGIVDARNGSILVNHVSRLKGFGGNLMIGQGHSFEMDAYGLTNTGHFELSGGTYLAPQLEHAGTLQVIGNASAIVSAAVFEDDSSADLHADLSITGLLSVQRRASVTGPGRLIIESQSTLDGLGFVDVSVVNHGAATMSGGTFHGASLDQYGELTVEDRDATLESAVVLHDDSTTMLNVDLTLDGSLAIGTSATLQGSGRLILAQGSTLNRLAPADVGVVNHGTIAMVDGTFDGASLEQFGQLNVEPRNPALLQCQLVLHDGSVTALGNDLRVTGSAELRPMATMQGTGGFWIAPGSLLFGEGTLGVYLNNYGILRPGGEGGGNLAVQGSVTMQPGSVFEHRVDALSGHKAVAGNGLVVTDVVQLGGTLDLEAIGKLQDPSTAGGPQWYGDQARTIIETSKDGELQGFFTAIPDVGTHLGRGVFLTDLDRDHQGVGRTDQAVNLELFQAADGDTNADRAVNGIDIQAILAANKFGRDLDATWFEGDFTGDTRCNGIDIQAILAANLFGTGMYATMVPEAPVDANVELLVTPDGLLIEPNGTPINGYVITSEDGLFTGQPAANLGLFREDTDWRISGNFAYTRFQTHRLGKVLGEGLPWAALTNDLCFTYTVAGAAGTFSGTIVVPEPTALTLFAVAMATAPVLWHRRKRRLGKGPG